MHKFKSILYKIKNFYYKTIQMINIIIVIIGCSTILYLIYHKDRIIKPFHFKHNDHRNSFQEKTFRCAEYILTSFEHDGHGYPLLVPSEDRYRKYLGYYSNTCYNTHKKHVESGKRITDTDASICLEYDINTRINKFVKEFQNFDFHHVCALVSLHYNIDEHYKFKKNKNGLTKEETQLFQYLKAYNELLGTKNINNDELVKLSVLITKHWSSFNNVGGIFSKGIDRRRDTELKIFFKL